MRVEDKKNRAREYNPLTIMEPCFIFTAGEMIPSRSLTYPLKSYRNPIGSRIVFLSTMAFRGKLDVKLRGLNHQFEELFFQMDSKNYIVSCWCFWGALLSS